MTKYNNFTLEVDWQNGNKPFLKLAKTKDGGNSNFKFWRKRVIDITSIRKLKPNLPDNFH